MKQKKMEKKLSLKRATVSNLGSGDMAHLNGGVGYTGIPCMGTEGFTCGYTCYDCLTEWICESNVYAWCTWDPMVCAQNSLGGCSIICP